MDKNTILKIIKNVSKNKIIRKSLYLNIERIKELYFQNGGPATIEITDDLGSELTGGIKAVIASVGSKISAKKGSRGQFDIPPLLMAIILEEYRKSNNLLLDPTADALQEGVLLKHVTDEHVHIVRADEVVSTQSTDFPKNIAHIVETERDRQVREYDSYGIPRKTIVWTSAGKKNLASVASVEYVVINNLMSFPSKEHKVKKRTGILGFFENEINSVIFISPLWIWQEV